MEASLQNYIRNKRMIRFVVTLAFLLLLSHFVLYYFRIDPPIGGFRKTKEGVSVLVDPVDDAELSSVKEALSQTLKELKELDSPTE